MTEYSKDVQRMLNEAGSIASELNRVNEGRCDVLTWVCALQLASRLVVAMYQKQEPEKAERFARDVERVLDLLANMVIVVEHVDSPEMARSMVFRTGVTKPEDVS